MLRAAVIGVGVMGGHHARVYNELDDVELVAVTDANAQRVEHVARRFKVPAYIDYQEMLAQEKPDVVSVAVPTSLHWQVSIDAMRRGVQVLVEKPIASTVEQAREMIAFAEESGVNLAIGHIERFNPAIIELKRRLDRGELGHIFLVHARRLGPFPERIQDMGVVIDLASHDLDIMLYLLASRVKRVYAETMRQVHTEHEDLLSGMLRFENGAIGVLDVSRLTPTKIRELTVTGEKGMFLVNYLTQDLCFYENTKATGNWESLGILKGVAAGDMRKLAIARKEPLRAELESFVHTVQSNEPPHVSGQDGLHVLMLALQLVESGKKNQIL